MPINPNIPPATTATTDKLDISFKPLDKATIQPLDIATDLTKGFSQITAPFIPQVTNVPTIIDANSLGIIVQGKGFGLVKTFLATAAINQTKKLQETIQKEINNTKKIEKVIPKNAFGLNRTQTANPNELLGDKNTVLFDDVLFTNNESVLYTINQFGQLSIVTKTILPDLLLNVAIVQLNVNRFIQQSIPVNSDAGTIKEIMAFGEYDIKITGHLVNNTNPKEYPIVAVKTLDALCKITTSVNVKSYFLSLFGINKILITDYTLEQVEGFSGICTYTITAVSDTELLNIQANNTNTEPINNQIIL